MISNMSWVIRYSYIKNVISILSNPTDTLALNHRFTSSQDNVVDAYGLVVTVADLQVRDRRFEY